MRITTIAASLLALTVGAGTLAAQPDRGGNAMPGRMPAVRAGGVPAAQLLRLRDQLVLTEEQVKRLETLAESQRKALTVSPGQTLRLRADLMDAMAGDGNPTAARAALDKMSAARNERIVAGMRARQEARAVLTPAQVSKLETQRNARGGARPGMPGQRGRQGVRGARGPQRGGAMVGPRQGGPGVRGVMPGRGPGAGAITPGRRGIDD